MQGGGDTSSYAGSTTGLGALTTAHLVIVAVFAVLVILAIIYGARLRARRKAGEAELRAHNATVERETPSPTRAPVAGTATEERLPEEVGRPAPMAPPTPSAEPARVAPVREDEPVAEPPALADEPIAAAAPMDASPASLAADLDASPAPPPPAEPAPAEPVPAATTAYRLTDLKGLGPKVAARLDELGITSVADLAALSDQDAAALNAQLGPFAGRMERDRWREQARYLAAGDRAGFEAAFGKL